MIRAIGDGAEPEVEVEGLRDRRGALGATDPLLPEPAGPVGPGVNFADLADDAGLDPLVGEPGPFGGMPLVAHLRDNPRLPGGFAQRAGLAEGVGERLLDIDMLAGGDGGHGGDGVGVVRGADGTAVEMLSLLVEHDAEVFVARRLGVGLEGRLGALVIDIAQADEVRAELGEGTDVAPTHAADPDAGEVDPFARRHLPRPAEDMTRDDHEAPGRARGHRGRSRSGKKSAAAKIRGGGL